MLLRTVRASVACLVLLVSFGCEGPVQQSTPPGDAGFPPDDDAADDDAADDDSTSDDDATDDDATGEDDDATDPDDDATDPDDDEATDSDPGGGDDDSGGAGPSPVADDDIAGATDGGRGSGTPNDDDANPSPMPEEDAGPDAPEPEPEPSTNDAGPAPPIDVELPPRPPVIPTPPPLGAFDESSCVSPRAGDHTIEIQADIVDLEGIDCILGNLNIWPSSLTSVLGLESLRYVSGTILVGVSQSLNSLSGLDGLEQIGGDLVIQQTPVLVSTTGLGALSIVRGDVRILENVILQTTAGLDALERVGGDVVIEDNGNLGSFAGGFSSLGDVGGKLTIRNSPVLSSMPEFDGVNFLGDGAEIVNNPYLGTISLSSVTASGGDVVLGILGTTDIELGELEGVLGSFSILDETLNATSPALANLDLASLALVEGDLTLHSGENLLELSLPSLSYVDGSAQFGILEAVLDLDVSSLARVGASLTLRAPRLRDVEFPALIEVVDVLDLGANERLDAIALPALTVTSGPIYLANLPALVSVVAPNLRTALGFELVNAGTELDTLARVDLAALETLDGPFSVMGCAGEPTFDVPALVSVDSLTFENNRFPLVEGFESLQTVSADVVVNGNETLVEFAGFDALVTIGSDLWVIGNPVLDSLSGLSHVQTVAGTFEFAENPSFGVLAMDLESLTTLRVRDNGMRGIDLPALSSLSTAYIVDNSGLGCLYLPSLTNVVAESQGGSAIFSVNGNASLPSCQVDAIIAQIENPDVVSNNTQNGSGGNCIPTSCR